MPCDAILIGGAGNATNFSSGRRIGGAFVNDRVCRFVLDGLGRFPDRVNAELQTGGWGAWWWWVGPWMTPPSILLGARRCDRLLEVHDWKERSRGLAHFCPRAPRIHPSCLARQLSFLAASDRLGRDFTQGADGVFATQPLGFSRLTSSGDLSSRRPRKAGWRR